MTEVAPGLRLLAAKGDPTDVSVFSGIPRHFLPAALRGGIVDGHVRLARDGPAFAARRVVWNATRPLVGQRHGGYQYTTARRNRVWDGVLPMVPGTCILNAWQLLPRPVVDDTSVEKWYFIDQPLTQLFDVYGQRDRIGRRIAEKALDDERRGYEAAEGIIVHSRWAAASLTADYGIPAAKVHVVTQAANLDDHTYSTWEAAELVRRSDRPAPDRPDHHQPLRLVFVGLEGMRKGLDRLLRGLALARGAGSGATLRVIGASPGQMPSDLRAVPGVEWCGRIDKQADPQRYLRLLSGCDVGCLLSRVEAGGCVLSEYQALGLAVLGTSAGGAPEQVLPGNGIIVDVAASDEEIAETILDLDRHRERVAAMRDQAWRQRRSSLWDARVAEIRAFWPRPAGGLSSLEQPR